MLKENTQKLIQDYFNLPIMDIKNIKCPYYNNAYHKKRAELRALIGKGTPQEIASEAMIISRQYGNNFLRQKNLTAKEIIHFLTEHQLGIDCSGLVSQILNTEKPKFFKKIKFPKANILRKLLIKLRPIENLSARVYSDNENTELISSGKKTFNLNNLKPLDLIIMLEIPAFKNMDHILLITEVSENKIKYIHSRQWQNEPAEESGVTEGIINIIKPQGNILEQEWIEKEKIGEENQTFSLKAKGAKNLEIRRLKI